MWQTILTIVAWPTFISIITLGKYCRSNWDGNLYLELGFLTRPEGYLTSSLWIIEVGHMHIFPIRLHIWINQKPTFSPCVMPVPQKFRDYQLTSGPFYISLVLSLSPWLVTQTGGNQIGPINVFIYALHVWVRNRANACNVFVIWSMWFANENKASARDSDFFFSFSAQQLVFICAR